MFLFSQHIALQVQKMRNPNDGEVLLPLVHQCAPEYHYNFPTATNYEICRSIYWVFNCVFMGLVMTPAYAHVHELAIGLWSYKSGNEISS